MGYRGRIRVWGVGGGFTASSDLILHEKVSGPVRLLGFIIKRLLSTVLILLAVSAISFFLLISSPGDPVRVNLA